jgi:hypothetical protein
MIRKLIIAKFMFLMFAFPGICQGEQLVINLSPSLKNRVFIFENPKGSIKIIGYDGDDIVVNATLRFPEAEKSGGNEMRRIEQNPLDIYAETDGNTVALYSRTIGRTVDFDIKIPRNFSLKLKSLDNGNIQVISINGEIEVENANGDISLENIAGSSVLSTVYGKINAIFREVRSDSPMMFTSFEGNISLEFPATINAVLKMKSGTGEIHTDFDLVPIKRQPVVKNVDNTRIYTLEDWVAGRVNAGGPEFIIRSYNGDITIRKKQGIK